MATRVVHHSKGYAALLKHPAVQADLRRRAEAVAASAGDDFDAQQSPAHTRARAAVVAPRGDSDNRMIRALDAGR